MKHRTRIIWVPYGYRLKPRAKLKKATIRQRVPAAPIKTSSRHSQGHQQHQAHKEQKKDEIVAVTQSGTVNNRTNEDLAVSQPHTTKNRTDHSSEDNIATKSNGSTKSNSVTKSYNVTKSNSATKNSGANTDTKSAIEKPTESAEESQVATFDDAFNPYKNYLQDMSLSLSGMPDEAFTRNENQRENFTEQSILSKEPAEVSVSTNVPELIYPEQVNSKQVNSEQVTPNSANLKACRTEQNSLKDHPHISNFPDVELETARQEHTFLPTPPVIKYEEPEESETFEEKRKHVGPHLRKLPGVAPSLMSEKYP
ncbi:hypothetical protein [Vibrio penaeicida]|uniref:hypothetical protein n=1 Tax=Vibrio penaeicida TaxID=104609 RepID=UPI000CEA0E24|nr:hypothetical protein [Vibrio penaeicida]